MCFNSFNSEEIARHADECAQKFDPIGLVPVIGSGRGSENEDNDEIPQMTIWIRLNIPVGYKDTYTRV